MTQTEALKLALEALEPLIVERTCEAMDAGEKAITAIKEVLAQPEQKPVAFLTNHRQRRNVQIKPEAFVWMPTTTDWEVPLYTAPPQRTWVGLTDDDLRQIILVAVGVAEAKLKEKNT